MTTGLSRKYSDEEIDNAIDNALQRQSGRREIAKTFPGFCLVYLSHYFNLEPADFHVELMENVVDPDNPFVAIIGFRGCAKSTIASLAAALWLGLEEKYHFIVLFGDTDDQSSLNLANLRAEIEDNTLLREDYGDMIRGTDSSKMARNTKTMLLANGVRYLCRSRGQKFRGFRHKQHRPDCVIVDDPEELKRIHQKEYRDSTERWLTGDVIPAIEELHAKLIVIANMLHTDSLMSRIKSGKIGGGLFTVYEYPLITEKGKVTWRGKYPTQTSLDRQKSKVGHTAWMREYLLKVVPPEGQEVKEEWIQRYDVLPPHTIKAGVGVDLAISKRQTADFTTMVSGVVGLTEDTRMKIFILPGPINARLSSLETQQQLRSLMTVLKIYTLPTFFIEDVAYQRSAIEMAQAAMLPVVAVRPGTDKRARLRTVATLIQNGTVLFPRTGCEDLIDQIVNFGIVDHDDLCLVGETKVATIFGDKKIKDIKKGDKIITPFGIKKVLLSKKTGIKKVITRCGITGTKNHPVFCNNKFVDLDTLVYNDNINILKLYNICLMKYKKLLYLEIKNINLWEGKESIILVNQIQIKGGKILKDFMWRFGNFIRRRKYQKALLFIIKMEILLITSLITLSVYRGFNISHNMQKQTMRIIKNFIYHILKRLEKKQISGTNQKREEGGIVQKVKNNGKTQKHIKKHVNFVKKILMRFITIQNIALKNVDNMYGEKKILKNGMRLSKEIEKKEVYNLLIEDDRVYYANGILVGNCDGFVYLCTGLAEEGLELPEVKLLF